MDIHVYLHDASEGTTHSLLREVLAGLRQLTQQGEKIMSAVDDLKAAVAAEDNEIAQALVFIQGVPALVAAAVAAAQAGDTATVAALTTDIQNQTAAIGAALAPAVPPT
jgi:hypothetical protein